MSPTVGADPDLGFDVDGVFVCHVVVHRHQGPGTRTGSLVSNGRPVMLRFGPGAYGVAVSTASADWRRISLTLATAIPSW